MLRLSEKFNFCQPEPALSEFIQAGLIQVLILMCVSLCLDSEINPPEWYGRVQNDSFL